MADVYANRDVAATHIGRHPQSMDAAPEKPEPSLPELLGMLVADAQVLVRKEFALARYEIQQEIGKARHGATILGAGMGLLAAGSILLLIGLVHGLVVWFGLPIWSAYLIVGAAVAIIGGIVAAVGAERLQQVHPIPDQAIDSVRKDIEWLTEQNPSDKT